MGILGLALSNPVLALGGFALVAVSVTAAYFKVHHDGVLEGREEIQAKWDSNEEIRRMANRAASDKLSGEVQTIRNKNARSLSDIQSRLDLANRELLQRANRRLDTDATSSGCAGAAGTELSRQDGGFLKGEAARAESLRSGLAACYDELDATREIVNGIKAASDGVAP